MGRSPAFRTTGWRLALLNAATTTIVVAFAGAVTFLLIRSSLNQQADHALAERVGVVDRRWRVDLARDASGSSAALPTPITDSTVGDEPDETLSVDLVESGDALLFVFDRSGQLVDNPRSVVIAGLPSRDGVSSALGGAIDARTLEVGDDATVRVYTAPVIVDGTVVGAVQAVRGQSLIRAELRAVGWASLLGSGLGAALAVTAGIFLARRAMRPVEAAFRRQQDFVADASHELRTPLALIRANVELVQRLPDPSPAEIRGELDAVVEEIDATNRLVDGLLLLARTDSAELTLQRRTVPLLSLAREAVAAMAGRAEAAGLTVQVAGAAEITVEADPERLRQVVRILLDNALAYTPAGGQVSVSVSVERHGSHGSVTVHDTGIGIAPDDLHRVFDRFYRADHARSRATGGTGLGLAIAHAIVSAHGGDIAIESRSGQGTTVRVAMPLSSAS